jgi:hypothetical protein
MIPRSTFHSLVWECSSGPAGQLVDVQMFPVWFQDYPPILRERIPDSQVVGNK